MKKLAAIAALSAVALSANAQQYSTVNFDVTDAWAGSSSIAGGAFNQGDGVNNSVTILSPISIEAVVGTNTGNFASLQLTINGSWESRVLNPFAPASATNIFTYNNAVFETSVGVANIAPGNQGFTEDCATYGGPAGNSCLQVAYTTNSSGNPLTFGLIFGNEPATDTAGNDYDLDYSQGLVLGNVQDWSSPRDFALTGGSITCLNKVGASCGTGATWQTSGLDQFYLSLVADQSAGFAIYDASLSLGWKSDTGGTGYGLQAALAVVPVPAAVWLFGSAVGLLGFARRRLGA
jgi:hypothetical protein